MHKEARTIKVTPDSEIALLIKEAVAAGANVVVDTGEARYPLQPVAGYLTRRLKGRPLTEDDPLFALAGIARSGIPGGLSGRKKEALARAYRPK